MAYGCHNRAPYVSVLPVQDGWYMDGYTRTPRMVSMPFRMSMDCNYTTTDLGQADPKCQGCLWRKNDAARPPNAPPMAHGAALDGCLQGPLLGPCAKDCTRPGDGGSAKPSDSGDAKALEAIHPNSAIYRRAE